MSAKPKKTARLSAALVVSLAVALPAISLPAISEPAMSAPTPVKAYATVLPTEARSQAACEAVDGRIFVETKWGSECVAYFVTKGLERQRRAVVFLDGDVPLESYADEKKMVANLALTRKAMQSWSDKLKIRYVSISRLGVNGSSGNHGERGKPKELMIMNAAMDALKTRLGLDTVALAGQSRGSTLAASMLSLGRDDVACAVLGSGAFELVDLEYAHKKELGLKASRAKMQDTMFDPASNAGGIQLDPKRRIFIIGDAADTRTPFDQQERYAAQLKALGHHAKLIRIEADGANEHGSTLFSLPTAGGCLKGTSDEQLAKANDNLSKRRTAAEIKQLAPPATGSAALLNASLRTGTASK